MDEIDDAVSDTCPITCDFVSSKSFMNWFTSISMSFIIYFRCFFIGFIESPPPKPISITAPLSLLPVPLFDCLCTREPDGMTSVSCSVVVFYFVDLGGFMSIVDWDLPPIGLSYLGAAFFLALELDMLSLSRSSCAPTLTSLLDACGALKLLPEEFMRRWADGYLAKVVYAALRLL